VVLIFFEFYIFILLLPDKFIHDIVLGTYYAAVIENRADFTGRVVVDVGAGSGILSLFAAQVARHLNWT
jgi:type I protein arginine methyltransferase